MTQNLQDYAQQLVNISISDEEDIINYSPIRQSNYPQVATQGQPSAKKSIATSVKGQAKSTASKTSKKPSGVKSTKDKTKEMKEQFEEQGKQLKWYQEEYQRLKDQKKQLKEEKTQYLLTINTYKTRLEQSTGNEKKLHQQLNEQMDVAKQALKQANDAQISLEQSKQNLIQQSQMEDLVRQRQKEDLEYKYQKKLDQSVKQAIVDAESKYELRIHQMNKELDVLRQENVELHKRLMQNETNKKHFYVQSEIDQLKTKYLTTKG
ncbi:unnamed protein product (macronuclear) [Paramecium tetraurelia]|uniref:Uncharacterized protein n=1 Tax=Paramecium tetraurelia TaxID=5888 RepID=A0C3D4_PARTE|nr:uncharacterized protein GSPATT00034780001 [Paramecium tetraurelia]CAK65301.1 unnamed protein product [Paramecium tetraurelia]|eukprot:XP_001432698.1 hypothetical protein (macronuclear) [Paramecium tetraurelia strain d4-2]